MQPVKAHDHALSSSGYKIANCRPALAVLALAAVLEGREEYETADGNIEGKPAKMMLKLIDTRNAASDTQPAT